LFASIRASAPFPAKNVTNLASVRIIDQAGGRSRNAKNPKLAFNLIQKKGTNKSIFIAGYMEW